MDNEYRCAHAVNKLVDWNTARGTRHVLELKKVLYEECYLSINIRENNSGQKNVCFTFKRTGSLFVDIDIRHEINGLSFKQRLLTTTGWLRIECGYDEIENLLNELEQNGYI